MKVAVLTVLIEAQVRCQLSKPHMWTELVLVLVLCLHDSLAGGDLASR